MACSRLIGTQRLEPDFWVLSCLFPCATFSPGPGLASVSWSQWRQGSFALHLSLLSAFIQYIPGSQSETTLLNKPLIIMPKTINTFQIPDAFLCLPASLEVTLGYASGSGQWTVKRSGVTSRAKYLMVGSWPSVLSFLASAARKSPLLESVSIRQPGPLHCHLEESFSGESVAQEQTSHELKINLYVLSHWNFRYCHCNFA